MSSTGGSVSVTVIIPTTGEPRRLDGLRRAVASVQGQAYADVELLVVANGGLADSAVLDAMRAIHGVSLEYLPNASLPQAIRLARQRVGTEYFCVLDDDDEYLPGALVTRAEPMMRDRGIGFVASNGYIHRGDHDRLMVSDPGIVSADPMKALLNVNWLASCGGLFRTDRVSIDYFDGTTLYFEWTLLAFRLAASMKMAFVGSPTFRVYDTSGSRSKSPGYRWAEVDVLKEVARLDLPKEIRRGVMRKLGKAYHNLSDHCRQSGEAASAWRFHVASLFYPGGASYLGYTRRLLAPRWGPHA